MISPKIMVTILYKEKILANLNYFLKLIIKNCNKVL